MLEQIPEMECHIDLALEMFESQTYTRGTICMEYKQTQKQDRKTQKFILLCTKDIGVTKHGSTGKDKSGDNKNKRQKKATSTEDSRRTLNLNQQKKPDQKKTPNKSKTKVKELKFCLPKIMLSNVRSISNKEEEFKKMLEDVENCDMICITETWMNSDSSRIDMPGYKTLWADRDPRLTQKHRGGGLMMLVNEAWATDVQVENIMQTPNYELMVVSIIPHNHPEGAPPLTFILVYIPPGAKKTQAAIVIADFYYRALEKYGGPVFLLGDFNHCNFDHLGLEQYVTCKTRKENTLDKCYGNVKGAYRSECRPPVGRSDHNVILLIPKDKSDESDSSEDEKCMHEKTKPRKQ
ncbi:uncharacterized protein LOC131528995 [Onychostoma macrolepis]|uniref:uncharacterized protein LOC131528995 n=1 Tax=Onychostoma macrolepis TaxID=369639 RepID=UPI00272B0521|nr:uncharacterized protein LOC131528995 [Onychostoma macrolepis]XP_058614474.1 uncharacterized protein LOC131528995 [Onychostoma macrolepis]